MRKTTDEYHDDMRIGFRDESGKLYLQRCPECKKENYALMVASGQCVFCRWNEGKEEG